MIYTVNETVKLSLDIEIATEYSEAEVRKWFDPATLEAVREFLEKTIGTDVSRVRLRRFGW